MYMYIVYIRIIIHMYIHEYNTHTGRQRGRGREGEGEGGNIHVYTCTCIIVHPCVQCTVHVHVDDTCMYMYKIFMTGHTHLASSVVVMGIPRHMYQLTYH